MKNKIFVSKIENGTIVEFSNGKNYALKFTEQEIKSIDERYWQFAVPVEV
ncbi:Phage protein [Lactococcus lactis subsp. lactis KF147]|nr:Phage protein [Lactococcus lactis subsp. lactis KF147]